jgi:hypothetical protein
MALIYLDEDVSVMVGPLLTRRGHDVIHAYDLNNRQVPDTEHLLFAASSGRVMLTHNREDFEELHRWWLALNAWGIMRRDHSGILTTWGDIPAGEWAGLVDSLLGQSPELSNRMLRYNRQLQRWRPYPP